MYEEMRTRIADALYYRFQRDTVDTILRVIDEIAVDYNIDAQSRDLAVIGADPIPVAARYYLMSRKTEGVSNCTLEHYELILGKFFGSIKKSYESITANDIRAWLFEYQQRRGVSNRTVESYRIVLHSFFTWCVDEGYLIKNPMSTLHKIKWESKPRKALTQIQLEYLRLSCQTLRERALVEVLYSTGCRIAEVATLTMDNLYLSNEHPYAVVTGKGNKTRDVYFNAKSTVALMAYLDNERPVTNCNNVFVSKSKPYGKITTAALRKILRTIVNRSPQLCGLNVTPHSLRHTMATAALQGGTPVEQVQKMLGHASLPTTMIYAEVLQDDVAKAHERTVI